VLDAGFLHGVVRVFGCLPGLQSLESDAFLPQQGAQAFVADVVDCPFGDQELCQLGQAPGGERQAVVGWVGLLDLLDFPPLSQGELGWPPSLVFGI